MNDLPTRLRRWTHDVDAEPASDLMDEAAAELERLRWRVKTLESAAKHQASRATLTDEEREAVEAAIVDDELMDAHTRAATLRSLLERLS